MDRTERERLFGEYQAEIFAHIGSWTWSPPSPDAYLLTFLAWQPFGDFLRENGLPPYEWPIDDPDVAPYYRRYRAWQSESLARFDAEIRDRITLDPFDRWISSGRNLEALKTLFPNHSFDLVEDYR